MQQQHRQPDPVVAAPGGNIIPCRGQAGNYVIAFPCCNIYHKYYSCYYCYYYYCYYYYYCDFHDDGEEEEDKEDGDYR